MKNREKINVAPFFHTNQQGAGVIKLLFLIPLLLIGLIVLFYIYTELNKAYWDREVRVLCEKDGGVTVYEIVVLSAGEYPGLFNDRGVLIIPSKNHAKKDDPFFIISNTRILRSGSPEIYRVEQSIIRKKDDKKLSVQVIYVRKGGDFPTGIGHHSSFLCGNDIVDINLLNSVITYKEV